MRGTELSNVYLLAAHLLLADGTPNYLPMLLTSSVYSILPASGTPLTPAVQVSFFADFVRKNNKLHIDMYFAITLYHSFLLDLEHRFCSREKT